MNFTALTEYLSQIDYNLIPDCEIIVYKDNECIYKNSFSKNGYDPSEAKKDMYFLFSATKVITCTAGMRLIQDDKLSLDDAVSKYLPEFAELYVLKGGKRVPAKNTLTVRHLFSMQGGFTYDLNNPSIKKVKDISNNKASTRQIVNALAEMDLIFEPGEDFRYSLCHDILAAVIEVAAGKKFSEYLHEVIFDPLGMNDVTFVPTEEVMARMKRQYRVDPTDFTAKSVETASCAFRLSENYESGGAGLIANAADYIKFVDALATGRSKDGYQILKPETVELMKTNQLGEKSLASFRAGTHNKGYGYAMGVRTLMDKGIESSLSPVGEFGWDGAAGAYCLIDTDNHISVFYGQHVLGCSYAYSTVHKSIRNLVYKALED